MEKKANNLQKRKENSSIRLRATQTTIACTASMLNGPHVYLSIRSYNEGSIPARFHQGFAHVIEPLRSHQPNYAIRCD